MGWEMWMMWGLFVASVGTLWHATRQVRRAEELLRTVHAAIDFAHDQLRKS